MRECELCGKIARMHCESDQASLCWDCDEKVHGANFLVAKHLRSLLCHICHSPTPWQASGRRSTPTVSVCESCMRCHDNKCEIESVGGNDEIIDVDENELDIFDSDDDEIIEEYDGDVEEDEEDGENQIVPWPYSPPMTMSPPAPAPAPAPAASASSSTEEEEFFTSKRNRQNADLEYSDGENEATSSGVSSIRTLKRSRPTDDEKNNDPDETRSMEIISSLRRLQNDVVIDVEHGWATALVICKLSRD